MSAGGHSFLHIRVRQDPPVGFAKDPSVTFLYAQSALLPTASTCDLQLRLIVG